MSARPMLDEERLCNRCGERPRGRGQRATWCRECKNAWQRERRAGVSKQYRIPDPVEGPGGCLLWQGSLSPNGYGKVRRGGRSMYAHRWAWEQVHGPLSESLVIDHLCRVRSCVNVEHMEPVTLAENTRRAHRGRVYGICKQHGEMDRRTPLGRRYCSTCVKISNDRRRELVSV